MTDLIEDLNEDYQLYMGAKAAVKYLLAEKIPITKAALVDLKKQLAEKIEDIQIVKAAMRC